MTNYLVQLNNYTTVRDYFQYQKGIETDLAAIHFRSVSFKITKTKEPTLGYFDTNDSFIEINLYELFNYFSILQIGCMLGCIPSELPYEFKNDFKTFLNISGVRHFCRNNDLFLIQLLEHHIDSPIEYNFPENEQDSMLAFDRLLVLIDKEDRGFGKITNFDNPGEIFFAVFEEYASFIIELNELLSTLQNEPLLMSSVLHLFKPYLKVTLANYKHNLAVIKGRIVSSAARENLMYYLKTIDELENIALPNTRFVENELDMLYMICYKIMRQEHLVPLEDFVFRYVHNTEFAYS